MVSAFPVQTTRMRSCLQLTHLSKKKTKNKKQHILTVPRLIIMTLVSGHRNLSTVSSRTATLPQFGEEPKLTETDGGVTGQLKHDDDPGILENPSGATVFTRSSTTDEKSWRYCVAWEWRVCRFFFFLIPQGLTVGVLCYDDPALCDWL